MRLLLLAGLGAVSAVMAVGQSGGPGEMHDASAKTYEHLANVIIATRQTEDSLVSGILMHYHALARRHLNQAMEAPEGGRSDHFEKAAEEIANIANEGDKAVQAIKQRLLKAGHHHHTDSETKEDYIFINSKEKSSLLELAGKVGKMGASTSAADCKGVIAELDSLFDSALKPE